MITTMTTPVSHRKQIVKTSNFDLRENGVPSWASCIKKTQILNFISNINTSQSNPDN